AKTSMRSALSVGVTIMLLIVPHVPTAAVSAASVHPRKAQPLTAAAAIELALPLPRFARDAAVQTAPDGTHYLAVFYQGDIARNGSWVTFVYGNARSRASNVQVDPSFRLFTSANVEVSAWIKNLRW